jgi:ADP-heptose:LPS heptosyltransferase
LLSSFIEKYIPLIEFDDLAKNISDNAKSNIDFICMCKSEEVGSEISNMKNIRHFDIDTDKPFTDTVAILKNIDLLITIDTSIVHLAGVMGVKTWLLLGYGSDWRWSTKDTTFL